MFETAVFRKQMYCIEESACDIVGTFRPHPRIDLTPPYWLGTRGIVPPFPPLVTPLRGGEERGAQFP